MGASSTGGDSNGNSGRAVRSNGIGARLLASAAAGAYLRTILPWNSSVQPSRQPLFNVPVVVLGILAAMCLVHAFLYLVLTPEQQTRFLILFAFIPARYDLEVLATESWAVGWGAAIWTFVTNAFIHINLMHLFFNAIWLLAFGTPVARRFGALRFTIFFAATAAAGSAADLVSHFGEAVPSIGASAAISGTMAASLRFLFQPRGPIDALRQGDEPDYRVPAAPLSAMWRDRRVLAFLAAWFAITLLFGLSTITMPGVTSNIGWQAHIGGFLAGLFGFALFDPVPSPANDAAPAPEGDTTLHQ